MKLLFSKTVWGALLLGLAQLVPVLATAFPWVGAHQDVLMAVVEFIGATFFGVGVRSAIAKNGEGV